MLPRDGLDESINYHVDGGMGALEEYGFAICDVEDGSVVPELGIDTKQGSRACHYMHLVAAIVLAGALLNEGSHLALTMIQCWR